VINFDLPIKIKKDWCEECRIKGVCIKGNRIGVEILIE